MAKTLVMAELARIVEEGAAVMVTLKSGTLELRLATGEVFNLARRRLRASPNLPATVQKTMKKSARKTGALFPKASSMTATHRKTLWR